TYDALGRPKTSRQQFYYSGAWSQPFSESLTYDLAGHVKTISYPSSVHTVSYSYDGAGRTNSFSGNLGGTQKDYATGLSYSPFGGLTQEQFGTQTAIFNQLGYNSRGQLAQILVGSGTSGLASVDRGKIVNWFSPSCGGAGCNTTDNN